MKKIFLLTVIISTLLVSTQFVFAQDNPECRGASGIFNSSAKCYQQLAPIQDPTTGEKVKTDTFPTYLAAMYRVGIGACFVLGVIMFTWAGIEYILSESMNTKSDAKKRIAAALTGLAIALVSFILLQTINPDLLLFRSLETSPEKGGTTQAETIVGGAVTGGVTGVSQSQK